MVLKYPWLIVILHDDISTLITFLLYELGKFSHRLFCRAPFTAPFYDKDKSLSACFNVKNLIIQIESANLGHPLTVLELTYHSKK